MSKQTPGPWMVHKERFGHRGEFISTVIRGPLVIDEKTGMTPNPMFVCEVNTGDDNAQLIAAAPEMLEALEAAVQSLRIAGMHDSAKRCEDAIAKARGGK